MTNASKVRHNDNDSTTSATASPTTSTINSSNNTVMHAELLRAKSRQRTHHLMLALGLFVAVLFTAGLITFSNGTRIEVSPKTVQDTATLQVSSAFFGFAMADTAYALYGNPTIEVTAFGFKPLRKTLSTFETGGTLRIELAELAQTLQLRTNPASKQTRWFIDGTLQGTMAELKQPLYSGQHSIDIDNPYFQKKSLNINMQLGKPLQRVIDLQKISGALNIATQPAGAKISINAQAAGTTPLSLQKTGGQYRLEISLADYQTISETVEITNSAKLIERLYHLAAKPASLSLHLSPANGILLLDGKKIALTTTPLSIGLPINSPINLAIKPRLQHILSYQKAGYASQQQRINLAPGQQHTLNFHLKAEFGKLDIRSQPKATIMVDGKNMGQTPQVLRLSARKHHIELRKDGYRRYNTNITASSKSTRRIRAVLNTESQARLRDAAPEMNNSIGIALKLFKPNSNFVMGAPRYEKGQRANEFLRTVKLNRPFYIAKYEISRAQYSRFRKTQGAGNEPVTSVSWIKAAQFCNWLSKREKLTPFYNIRNGRYQGFNSRALGYRLPSEAEWEWLARKADKGKQSKFSWGDATTIPANAGNIADEYAKGQTTHYVPNYSDAYAGIAPVGSYPAEKSGLFDITGNVSEWVHDVYSLIPSRPQNVEHDPLGTMTGDSHTVKGSNWRSGTITELRASYREGATKGRDDIGFRIARYIN